MRQDLRLPPHLCVLRGEWAALATRLACAPLRSLAVAGDSIGPDEVPQVQELSNRQLRALNSWIERLMDWTNGPLATALANPAIDEDEMRRVSGRFGHFADELLYQRRQLAALAEDPTLRTGAAHFDAAWLALLQQTRAFAERIVAALDAAGDPWARHEGDTLELSFTFVPNIDVPMAALQAWIQGVTQRFGSTAPPRADTAPHVAAERPLGWIALFVLAVCLFALALPWLGSGIALLIIGIALIVIVIRHPLLALLAFLLGIS